MTVISAKSSLQDPLWPIKETRQLATHLSDLTLPKFKYHVHYEPFL